MSPLAALLAYLVATHLTARHHDARHAAHLGTPFPILSVPLGIADHPDLDGSGDDVPIPLCPVSTPLSTAGRSGSTSTGASGGPGRATGGSSPSSPAPRAARRRWGPWWLWREIQQAGPATTSPSRRPTTCSSSRCSRRSGRSSSTGPEGAGRYWAGDRIIELADPATGRVPGEGGRRPHVGPDHPPVGRVRRRPGVDDGQGRVARRGRAGRSSSATTWEAIQRRLSLHLGRAPAHDDPVQPRLAQAGSLRPLEGRRPDFDVVQFDSTENPPSPGGVRAGPGVDAALAVQHAVPGDLRAPGRADLRRLRRVACHKVPRFAVPRRLAPRYLGLDFGGVNTAGVFYAEEPGTRKLYPTASTRPGAARRPSTRGPAGGRADGPDVRRRLEVRGPVAGGVPGRGRSRACRSASRTIKDVEVGIGRVYGAHKRGEILVFDDLAGLPRREALLRPPSGEPGETIEDKNKYHFMDAERYIVSWLRRGGSGGTPSVGGPSRAPVNTFTPPAPRALGPGVRMPVRPGVPGVPGGRR
jgi:hypothetical protein